MEKKKIAMMTTAHHPDDVRIYEKEAKALSENGYPVLIINPYEEGTTREQIRFSKAPIPVKRAQRMTRGWRAAAKAAVKAGAGVCHLHDPELLFAVPLLKSKGMRVIYDAHEDLSKQVKSKEWIPAPARPLLCALSALAERRYASMCDLVIGATPEISSRFKNSLTIRNLPTEEDIFLFDEAQKKVARRGDAVCYAGAITRQRGAETMIKACYGAGAKLLLAGEFESAALREGLESLREYACVEYRGRLDRMGVAKLYAQAGAGLLLLSDTPSYRDSLPIKLFEYLCAGLPVVASDFSSWRRFNDGQIRFVDPEDDGQAMRAVKALLSCPQPLMEAQEKKASARKRYSFSGEKEILLKAYGEIGEIRH